MNQQTAQVLQNGLGFVQDLQALTDNSATANAKDRAGVEETEARKRSWEASQEAKRNAERIRNEGEKRRGRENTSWGGANLAMSGSKEIVRDAGRIQDLQEEDDTLYEGQSDAETILDEGRQRANILRINSGVSPQRSTLSMGSQIYGTRK